MRKERLLTLLGSICLVLVLAALLLPACAKEAPAPAPEAEVIVVTFGGNLPVAHELTQQMYRFRETVKAKSDGKIIVQCYPAGQLYTDKTFPKAVPEGSLNIAQVNTAYWSGLVPALEVAYSIALFESFEHAFKAETETLVPIFNEGLSTVDSIWLGVNCYSYPMQVIATREPIRTMADFAGKKIRTWSACYGKVVEAWGGTSVQMSSSEYYMALQRGTIDGVGSGLSSMVTRHMYEVAPYMTFYGEENSAAFTSGSAYFGIIANLTWWNSVPKWAQDIIVETTAEVNLWGAEQCKAGVPEYLDFLKEKVTVIVLPPGETAKMLPIATETSKAFVTEICGPELSQRIFKALEEAR